MQIRRTAPGTLAILMLLLAVAVLVAVPRLALAAWDGTQDIGLGDRVSAEFAANDASHHRFSFFATKDTLLTVKAKGAPGLVMVFALHDDHEDVVPMGAAASAAGVKSFKIPSTGVFTLDVSRQAGLGRYLLTTAGKFPAATPGTATLAGTSTFSASFQVGARAGSTLDALVRPGKTGGATAPVIKTLTYPGGSVTVTQGERLSKIVLPVNANYSLGLGGGSAGAVDLLVKVKAPKLVKKTFSFGVVEITDGMAQQIRSDWAGSPHADVGAEAFRHWDEDGEVEEGCAKCHSSGGYCDWVGADNTAFESIEAPAPLGTTVDCAACHNSATATLDTCLFPSGARIDGLGAEARCMQCHQGRESMVSMNTMITLSGLEDDSIATGTVPSGQSGATDKLSFRNVHYLAAAATLYGREAQGGYQYEGKHYNGKLQHVQDYDSCIECHDQHTTELRLTECAQCHQSVTDLASVRNIRMTRTVPDYDGDGNDTEGVSGEISGLADALLVAIKANATANSHPIMYDGAVYPYFISDPNGNGVKDAGEGTYAFWTPRLVRAAYNYQYWAKEPGAYAHNPRYAMQLLYDSIEDVGGSVANLVRGDSGHFDATSMAYRDWDKAEGDSDGLVNMNCAQCHSGDGFKLYAANLSSSSELSIVPAQPAVEGMPCESCHQTGVASFSQATPPLRYVASVFFASSRVAGTKKLSNNAADPDPSFVCMTCHQGRQSKETIDFYITNNATGTSALSFQNVHYLPAGAVLYGKDAQVGYEYTGKTYAGKWTHNTNSKSFQCTYCHLSDHTFRPQITETCSFCHGEVVGGNIETLRYATVPADYDGNAATTTLKEEVEAYGEEVYEQIREYAFDTLGHGIRYDGSANPYWFNDLNGDGVRNDRGEDHLSIAGHLDWDDNGRMDTEDTDGDGVIDVGEDTNGNSVLDKEDANSNKKFDSDWGSYAWWDVDIRTGGGTPVVKGRMLMAAHNYQLSHKEPGAWAHNTKYILQLLYDSVDDLNGGVANDVPLLTRP